MKHNIYYRNPENDRLEAKEFADAELSLLRIADPIAQNVVQGFTPVGNVGDQLFPIFKTAKESGRFPAFGKEVFVIPGNLKRALGEKIQRLNMQTGYVQIALSEYAEGVAIENRERNEWGGTPDQLVNMKLLTVAGRIANLREQKQAVLATTSGSYASGNSASGATNKWATDGAPIYDLRQGKITIEKKIGRSPNVAWFTPTAWELFLNNRDVKQTLKGLFSFGSATPGIVTPAMAAAALEVDKVIIGRAVYGTGAANGADGGVKKSALTMNYLWEATNNACAGLAYVGSASGMEPSFGYTYERMNSPVVESYYENQTKSQVWDYEHFFEPAVTLNEAGYLLYAIA